MEKMSAAQPQTTRVRQATGNLVDKVQDTSEGLLDYASKLFSSTFPNPETRQNIGFVLNTLWISLPLAWIIAGWVFFSDLVLVLSNFWLFGGAATIQRWIGQSWNAISIFHLDLLEYTDWERPLQEPKAPGAAAAGSFGQQHLQKTSGIKMETPLRFVFFFGVINPVVSTVSAIVVFPLTILAVMSLLIFLPYAGATARELHKTQKKLAKIVLFDGSGQN